MYIIEKSFSFSASHQLCDLPPEHPCAKVHGHNYSVRLCLKGEELDDTGMLLDYRSLKPFKAYLDSTYDHMHLNDMCEFHPTAENLARELFAIAKGLFGNIVHAVHVKETEKTSACYYE